jgi:hypothetical protein
MLGVIQRYKDRIDQAAIPPKTTWRGEPALA